MESKYKPKVIANVFKALNDEQSLYIMGLSLAFNDLVINHDSLSRYPENENVYFFSNSISIIRELALLVVAIDSSNLTKKFSENTQNLFESLKTDLIPFHDESIVKKVLKPIRDLSFHYNLNNLTRSDEADKIKSVLGQLRKENNISVGLIQNETSLLGQRYTYADSFRNGITSQFLTTEIVSKISTIAVNVAFFVDSLVTDLHQQSKNKG